jgi:sarcosine oxidase subunit gamma
MSERARTSPLAHRPAIAAGAASVVAIGEVAGRAMLDLRIAEGDAAGRGAAATAEGLALPEAPRTSSVAGGRAALWMSVDQWLVTAPLAEAATLAAALERALDGRHAMVTDVSDARAIIRLSGAGAREIVMKGGPADLTRPDFAVGTARRMSLAGIAAMVHAVAGEPDALELYVARSVADYAWDWIVHAARPAAAVRLFTRQPPAPV